jgi:hypothetical protein
VRECGSIFLPRHDSERRPSGVRRSALDKCGELEEGRVIPIAARTQGGDQPVTRGLVTDVGDGAA